MTIKIIERPDCCSSWWHVCSNVRTVTDRSIVLHSGVSLHKNYGSKIEILSVFDAPEGFDEMIQFYRNLHGYTEADWLANPLSGYINKMRESDFDALDLPTHFN